MKNFISHLFSTLPMRIFSVVVVGLLVAFPVASIAADSVTISATTGGANLSTGQTSYTSTVSASYNQEVEVQIVYLNPNPPSSGLVAGDVRVKANIPTTPGYNQVVTTDVAGNNTNDVAGQVTFNLNNSNDYLQYVPGSTHAKVTNNDGSVSSYDVPDSQSPIASLNSSGYLVDNGDPCNAAGITFLMTVMQPGVSITKQVEEANQTNAWVTSNTANPGDTLKYLITYKNAGNTVQNQVLIRDNLPPQMTLVSGSTYVYNQAHPDGIQIPDNDITAGGIDIGNYGAGAIAYIELQAQVPQASALGCGTNLFQNVGGAQPQGMQWYYNVASTVVNKTCPSTPTYSCNSLNIVQGDNRTVTASFDYTAENGATFNNVTYNFGDNTTPLTTNEPSVNHTYAQDGTYTVTATANFTVNGEQKSVSSEGCTKTVTFSTPTTPTPTPTTPTSLVNTGPGSVVGIFAGATIAGAVGHRLFKMRRFARNGK